MAVDQLPAKKITLQDLPLLGIVLASAILLSVFAAALFVHYDFHNLHFDSKGHQLVARRIFDNLSPGWIQIGAFWLPLPHVLYLPLVHSDYLYFHGLAGIPFSMLSFIASAVLLFRLLERIFGRIPAFAGAVLFLTNPNILYVQSTSLTEPLMIFFQLAATERFVHYIQNRRVRTLWLTSALCGLGNLVRYDNWFVFGLMGLLLIVIDILERRGLKSLLLDGLILGSFGFLAVGLSFWINYATTTHWYIDITHKYTDFHIGRESYLLSFFLILYTLSQLISWEWMLLSLAGFISAARRRFRDPAFLASLAMLGPLILYIVGYHSNHPMRIRYGLSVIVGSFFFAAVWAGRSRFGNYLFAIYVLYMALFSPFYTTYGSELMLESMRDVDSQALTNDLLWYLKEHDDGTLILVAMGDIAPVIYDLKLPIKRFVHEGAKPWWNDARKEPERWVGWVFMTQDDRLWRELHDRPEFHRHFELIGRRGFLELYRRSPDEKRNIESHRPHGTEEKIEIKTLGL